MEDNLGSLINSSKSILILLPNKPYFDQVAAGLGLFLTFRNIKETTIACPTDMTVEFNRLIGINKVVKEMGNKNMVIRFADYRASDIEKLNYDVDEGDFKLSIIPINGVNPPAKDQVLISYSGVNSDLVILIGGANASHFPALSNKDFEGIKKVHLGIRGLQAIPEDVLSYTTPVSSDSELVAEFIKQSGVVIGQDAATNLMAGIEAGSNKFSGVNVTAETFQTFAELMRLGGKRMGEQIEAGDFPPGAIPSDTPQHKEQNDTPPKGWTGPKIYKGTTIN